jgi:prefoldin beta subunit
MALEAYRRAVEELKQMQAGEKWGLWRANGDTPVLLLACRPLQTAPPLPRTKKTDLQQNASAQQTLMQQQHENDMVLAELERLEAGGDGEDGNGDIVFKLMGPALVRQDQEEAVATVRKRLDFIRGELGRLEAKAQAIETGLAEGQANLAGLQAEAIKAQAGGGGGGGGGPAAAAVAAMAQT